MGAPDALIGAGSVGTGDNSGLGKAIVRILRSDTHVYLVARVGLGEETHEDDLLLEGIQHGGNVVKVEGSTGQVRGARDNDLRLALTAQDVREGRTDRGNGTDQLRPGRGRGSIDAGLCGRGSRTITVHSQVFSRLA